MSASGLSRRLPRVVAHAAKQSSTRPLVQTQISARCLSSTPITRSDNVRSRRTRPWAQRPQSDQDSTPETSVTDEHTQASSQSQQQPGWNTQLATTLAESDSSDLVTDVHIPSDPHGILPPNHPALSLLGNSSLVIQRQLEMMNVMMGFEQANRYVIMDGQGNTIGYIAERDHGIGSAMVRQVVTTHRSFTVHIFDREEREVLRIHRPFSYINSRIRIYDPVPEGGYQEMETSTALQGTSVGSATDSRAMAGVSPLKLEEMRIIGEAKQQWAPLRRKYNLFSFRPLTQAVHDAAAQIESDANPTTEITEAKVPDQAIEAGMVQFAAVNEPFLSWDFNLRDEQQNPIGSVNRNFRGFAREIFTDTGIYVLRMDAAQATTEVQDVSQAQPPSVAMTLDQRAVMLATAVCIDFDYFSRHSGAGGLMPFYVPMAAGEGAAGAGAAGAAGAAGEAGAVGAGVAGTAARGAAGVGATGGESAVAGAGALAGYDAMQRGVYGEQSPEQQAPQQTPETQQPQEPPQGHGQNEEIWHEDPWGKGGGSSGSDGGGGGGGGGGDGGSWLDAFF